MSKIVSSVVSKTIYEIEKRFRGGRQESRTGCRNGRAKVRRKIPVGRTRTHDVHANFKAGIRARAHVVNVLSFGAYGVRGTVFARRSAGPVKCLVDPRKTPWRSGRISQT